MRWLIRRRLNSKDAEVRQEAIDKLRPGAGVEDISCLAKALHDENAAVRRAAISAIAVVRETAAKSSIEVLLPWLKNPDFSLRTAGASALDLLGWHPSTSEERVLVVVAQGNFNCIGPREEAAVDVLLPLLGYESQSIRFAVAQTLEQLQIQDPRLVAPLVELLKDAHLPVCVAALQALAISNDERRIAPLLSMFKHPAPQVRAVAVEAIGKTGKAEYLGKISSLLKDSNFEVRLAAIKSLGQIQSPDVFAPIVSMLKDRDTDMRKGAVESLTRLRDPSSVPALIRVLVDTESIVRHAAANALQIINPDWEISREAQDAIPFFEDSLKHDEYWVREAATKTLKRIRTA